MYIIMKTNLRGSIINSNPETYGEGTTGGPGIRFEDIIKMNLIQGMRVD
jgi:hypothetical protein